MPRVVVLQDKVEKVLTSVKRLTKKQVLVGFPESDPSRRDPGDPNNATIGYVNETGSPARNIPARPFLSPGVEKSLPKAMDPLQAATQSALDGDVKKSNQYLHAAGTIAEVSVKEEIASEGNFVPLSPKTVAQRYRGRGAKSRRQDEQHYAQLISQGFSPAAAETATGIRPLNNTGQLRNAVTHVVRNKSATEGEGPEE